MVRQTRRDTVLGVIARFRVALGFVSGVLVLILAQPTGRTLLIGMSIAACGEAIRIWAAGHLRRGTCTSRARSPHLVPTASPATRSTSGRR
jgi:uncharacterized membrane protein YjjB (DUF3815 family)